MTYCFEMFFKLIVHLIVCCAYITDQFKMDIDTQIIKDRLEDFVAHALKKQEMQDYLDNLKFVDKPADGEKLLNDLVTAFQEEYSQRIKAVKRLHEAAVLSFTTPIPSSAQCCTISSSDVVLDSRFKRQVNLLRACDYVSVNSPDNPYRLTEIFRQEAVKNLQELPTLKWQYFGSDQGVTSMYPSIKEELCGAFDCRTRPWYVQASVPLAKEVVIVLDKSGSMSEVHGGYELMTLAKEAATAVLSTLNPYDKVTVLAISDKQEVLSDRLTIGSECFQTRLAQATPQNKKNIAKFVEAVQAGGGTYYVDAIDRAFQFFKSEEEKSTNVERVVHIMSDGLPNDTPEEILEKLLTKHEELNNTVVIMTYGIGTDENNKLLKDLSRLNPEFGKKGEFLAINSPTQLKNLVSTYYKLYSASSKSIEEPIWTVPYLDRLGLGQMITASLPVYKGNSLIGVVGVDLTLDDLLAKASFTQPNEFTYAFVIDKAGLVINHPLFPYVDDNDSLFVEATAFERDPEFKKIFEAMKRGETGKKQFQSVKVKPEGDSKKYGVSKHTVTANYYWKRITGTTFSVCVVSVGTKHTVLSALPAVASRTFLYHRIDLLRPTKPCNHFGTFAASGQTTVFLSSRTFSDRTQYFNRLFTGTDIQAIINYMEGLGTNTFNLKPFVRDEVAATFHAEELWTKQDENTAMQSEIVWRFLTTANGVYRVYPGTQLPDSFDPISRPWYNHALAQREKSAIITPPYEDIAGGGGVITISQVLFKNGASGNQEKGGNIFGVMGMDILLIHFNNLFIQWYPICQSSSDYACYLIDNAGFIIATNNIAKGDGTLKSMHAAYNWEAHLTELEPEIANLLIEEGVMQRINCSNIEAGKFQKTYIIRKNQPIYIGSFEINFYDVFDFKLVPVEDTNTFILIRILSPSVCKVKTFTCPCSHVNVSADDTSTCITSITENSCECPCSAADPTYVPCQNSYVVNSSSPLPCPPRDRLFRSESHSPIDISYFDECFNISFSIEEVPTKESSFISPTMVVAGISGACALVIGIFACLACRSSEDIEYEPTNQLMLKELLRIPESTFSLSLRHKFESVSSYSTKFKRKREFWFDPRKQKSSGTIGKGGIALATDDGTQDVPQNLNPTEQ